MGLEQPNPGPSAGNPGPCGSNRVSQQLGGPGRANQVCLSHSCFSSPRSPLICASVSLPGKSGFAAVCVNKGLFGPFASSRGSVGPFASPKVPLGMNQHRGCPRKLPHSKEKGKGTSWGSAGASRASLRGCLEGACEKHELLGELCAFQSMELSLDSSVLPNTITLC